VSDRSLAIGSVTTTLVLVLVMALLFVGELNPTTLYAQMQPLYQNRSVEAPLPQATRIYDRNGNLLMALNDPNGRRRTYVTYTEIAPVLVNATIAVEDPAFWVSNEGSPLILLRAAMSSLQGLSPSDPNSTITEQLIESDLLSAQTHTLQLKEEEAILDYSLMQQYPKWKIMERYLNTLYFGDLDYGIEAAAQDYFHLQPKCTKRVCQSAASQLDLAQASLLAGLPQSPSSYNPITNKAAALARQQSVLQSMIDLNMITEQQARQAEAETARFTFQSYSARQSIQAPHFVYYVVDQVLVPLLGAQNLLDGGYNIYTTLDLNVEKKVEQIVYNNLYTVKCDSYLGCNGPLDQANNINNASAVVENPFNGEILAMDGSANYNDSRPQVSGRFNAALALRQPGSAFKPFVYATAFEMGWYPAMILPDHRTTYPTPTPGDYYTPQNYDGHFHTGFPMTVRNAIANSFNIPALDAMEYTGIPNELNTAARFGLTEISSRSPSSLGPSLALGAAEVSLLHLTGAYATFANRGVRVPPVYVLRITDELDRSLYTYDEAHPYGVQAIRADVAFLMNSMLSDKTSRYHEFAPGNPLELDRPAAVMPGTTDSFRDNWTLGYTPYLAVGVWAGNSDYSPMLNLIGITGVGPIWHDIMAYASQYYHFPPK